VGGLLGEQSKQLFHLSNEFKINFIFAMRSSFSPGGADATINNTLEEKIVGSPTRTAHPTSQEKVRP
jgi:hypothetical protein